jgi:DNA (cytosine-5)-methyltransferase 1
MRFGSLFAGIGGMDLGLERAGMQCAWQVEIDHYARRVLEKHWPSVRRHDDVRTFPPAGDWSCDLIAGGFPCQDISNAGRRAGIDGERSGLWGEFARIICVLRPRFVLVENVAALLGRGMGRVVGDLAECGYDAEWDCLPAAAFGALHIRNRVFLLAYSAAERQQSWRGHSGQNQRPDSFGSDPQAIADSECGRRPSWWQNSRESQIPEPQYCGSSDVHDSFRRRYGTPQETVFAGRGGIEPASGWAVEPDVGRVADGVPARVDRLRGLGNSVVPQVAQWLGERIMETVKESP